jgi:hypothetical protein
MTRTISYALCSANLALLLLAGCGRDAGDAKSGSSRNDAGEPRDSSTPLSPNQLQDAAVGGESGGTGGTGRVDAGRTQGGSQAPDQPGAGGAAVGGSTAEPPQAAGGSAAPSEPFDGTDAGSEPPAPVCASCGACEEVIPVVSTMHTTMMVKYPDPPPTSGPHNPCWARWGRHDEPLQAERWVHNLEHGGVVFLYNCPDGCPDEVEILARIASRRARHILAAYPDLPTRFALASWGHRLVSDCLDEAAFTNFYTNNFDHAPESNANPPNPGCPP